MKVPFEEMFEEVDMGIYRPRTRLRVGRHVIGPGDLFTGGVCFGAFAIGENRGRAVDVDTPGGETILRGFS